MKNNKNRFDTEGNKYSSDTFKTDRWHELLGLALLVAMVVGIVVEFLSAI